MSAVEKAQARVRTAANEDLAAGRRLQAAESRAPYAGPSAVYSARAAKQETWAKYRDALVALERAEAEEQS